MHVCYGDADTARTLSSALTPIQAIAVHPKGYWLWLSVQDVPDTEKPEDWIFQLQWTWKTCEDTATLATLDLETLQKEAESTFGEPYRTAWLKILPGTRVAPNKISVWHPQPIPDGPFKGKVALLGDTAHAMSFHRGQGLNHGIADACKIVEVVQAVRDGKMSLAQAMQEYEDEMVKRAGEEVAISKMNTEMMHDWPRLMQSPFMQRGGDKNK